MIRCYWFVAALLAFGASAAVGQENAAPEAPAVQAPVLGEGLGNVLSDGFAPAAQASFAPRYSSNLNSGGVFNGDGRSGWSGGAGAAFVQPRWSSNPALYAARTTLAGVTLEERTFNWNQDFAPFVWIGFTAEEGLGVRGQWFSFDGNSANETELLDGLATFALGTPTVGGLANNFAFAGDTFTASSGLKLQVVDFEFTKAFVYRRGQYTISGGTRYAYINQSYRSQVIDANVVTVESFNVGHNDSVIGPTGAIQVRYPTLAFPRLGLYGKARGGLLFGNANRTAVLEVFGASYRNSADVCVPMTELEAGFDWSLNAGQATFFAQAGVMAQTWFGVGNASGSSTLSLVPAGISATDTSDLTLFGIKTSIGFTF